MSTVEIEGKTIDEAIEKACREFNVPRGKLNIEIISEGTAGFLGIGSKKALIKASLMNFDMAFSATETEQPPVHSPLAKPAHETMAPVERPPAKPAPAKPAAVKPVMAKTPAAKEAPVTRPVPSVASEAEKTPSGPDVPPAYRKADKPAVSDEKIMEKAKAILEGILSRMGVESPVVARETDEAITLNIEADSGGLLIGKRGQNLDAIQYIVNKATNQAENGRKPIIIDSGSYRKRREESLVTLAAKLGDKVKKTKKAVTVSNMNAHDRRIIHLALQNDASLITKSRGEGEYRKIVIMLAKKPRGAKSPS
jgi:spoIIIJ-associated protein